MILIVGLGNPGKEYEYFRHNMGFIMLDNILGKVNWNKSLKMGAFLYKDHIGKKEVTYLKPQTFMNNSGSVISCVQTKDKIKTKDIIVIYDDIDLPLGSLKISFNRSSGGHNGLESIIKKVKSREFIRIRIGISSMTPAGKIKKAKGEEAVLKFILGSFKEDDLKILKRLSKKVSQIIEMILSEGKDKAMSIFN